MPAIKKKVIMKKDKQQFFRIDYDKQQLRKQRKERSLGDCDSFDYQLDKLTVFQIHQIDQRNSLAKLSIQQLKEALEKDLQNQELNSALSDLVTLLKEKGVSNYDALTMSERMRYKEEAWSVKHPVILAQ